MNEKNLEIVREYNFDPKEVIKGLNGYYESDKRNSYITIRRNDVEGPAYLSTLYLSALIEWLREDHDVFYHPGMGIHDSREAGMEGKKEDVWKNVMNCIRQEPSQNGFDLPSACRDLIEDLKKRDAEIKKLNTELATLKEQNEILKGEVRQLNRLHIEALDGIKILNAELATKWTKTSLINWLQQRARRKGVELDDAFLYSDDAQYDWTDIVNFLFDEIVKMRGEIKNTTESNYKDIMNYIRYEASQNGFELPEEIDGEPLTIKRVFHDLLELMMKRGAEIRYLNVEIKAKESGIEDLKEHITLLEDDLKKRTAEVKEVNNKRWKDLRDINKLLGYDGVNSHIDDFAIAVKARAECVKMALGEESDIDINSLIRDWCTKNDIIAPSPYFSDKACVEYLFSVIKLDRKDRAAAILYDLYHDIFHKDCNQFTYEDIATKILNKVLETEDLLHKSVDSVNKECKAVGKQMVDDYEKDLLKFIYKEYKGRIHLSEGFITYDPPSVRNTVLKIIRDYASCRYAMDTLETQIKSIYDKHKTDFTVDDYVINGDPTSSFMLSGINSWISSPAFESRGKIRAEIENYKLNLKDYILKDIKEHGYRYDGLETKSIEEIVDRIIQIATSDHSFIVLKDIYTTVASPVERFRYNDSNGPTVDHMKEYILRRFEGLHANTEYCLKKMSEFDGCQKELRTLKEQREDFMKQNAKLAIKIDAKDDEISRLKDLINAMNEEVKDM